jgi:hypothetical protein
VVAYIKKDRPYIGTVLPNDPNKKGQRNSIAVMDQNGGACPPFGVAASTRETDLQNLTRVPRFGESIDRQKSKTFIAIPSVLIQ